MKLNTNKAALAAFSVFDVAKEHRIDQAQNNKHRNRRHRYNKMYKAAWRRELNRQFNEEILY